jgi:predicted phage terminase large subunit-like protein
VTGKNLFLLGLFRKRLEYPALKRAVRDLQRLFNASVVLIEDKASGTQLIQDLIADGCHGFTRYQPTGDKTMRLHAPTAVIENGFVHIPETAPWLAEYLHELAVFPNGKHDDQPIRPRSSSTGSKCLSSARASMSFTACREKRPSSAAKRLPSMIRGKHSYPAQPGAAPAGRSHVPRAQIRS